MLINNTKQRIIGNIDITTEKRMNINALFIIQYFDKNILIHTFNH